MELIVKRFAQLTTTELYEILKARAQVFVVEQQCCYQDLDDIDRACWHMFFLEDGSVTAYLRAFASAADPAAVQIGRVLTRQRGAGHGRALMEQSLAWLQRNTAFQTVVMEAQCYATGFYEKFGFRAEGEPFLDVGIPHIFMQRSCT